LSGLPTCLWAFEAGARDDSPRNVVQVPLVLLPAVPVLAAELDRSEPQPCIPHRASAGATAGAWPFGTVTPP